MVNFLLISVYHTMWVASPWGLFEMTIQPARHGCHACCLLRARFLAFQPVVDNTCGTRVEQVVSSFQKILRGSQLTWYVWYPNTHFQGGVIPWPSRLLFVRWGYFTLTTSVCPWRAARLRGVCPWRSTCSRSASGRRARAALIRRVSPSAANRWSKVRPLAASTWLMSPSTPSRFASEPVSGLPSVEI